MRKRAWKVAQSNGLERYHQNDIDWHRELGLQCNENFVEYQVRRFNDTYQNMIRNNQNQIERHIQEKCSRGEVL